MARGNGKTNGQTNGKANGKAKGKASAKHDAYDSFKEFEGKRYTGMKVGRGHKWQYEPGIWTEKKVTPDQWEIRFAVTKRRRGKAPEGSGVPVGTAYHWYILAHQTVTKLDANSYETDMAGVKYKLAHRRADKSSWSASDRAQRKRLIKILRKMADDLEQLEADAEPAPLPRALRAAPARSAKPKTRRRAEVTSSAS
jgi:hypothetical protein